LGNLASGSSVISVNSTRGSQLTDGELRSSSRRVRVQFRCRAGVDKAAAWLPLASWPSFIAWLSPFVSFSPPLYFPDAAAMAEPPSPLSFFHLRAFSNPTECTTTFAVICRPSCAPFSVATAAVVPLPPEQSPASRLLAWPAGHRPPLTMLRPPTSAHQPPGASPPFPRHCQPFSGRHRPIPWRPLFKFASGTSY